VAQAVDAAVGVVECAAARAVDAAAQAVECVAAQAVDAAVGVVECAAARAAEHSCFSSFIFSYAVRQCPAKRHCRTFFYFLKPTNLHQSAAVLNYDCLIAVSRWFDVSGCST
jgi:hypothetical protein